MNLYIQTIRTLIEHYPEALPHLKGRARWIALTHSGDYKTYDYYLSTLERLVRSVYRGDIAGDFIDIMANLISGQLTQAFTQAWNDEGTDGDMPPYLSAALEDMILGEYEHVDGFYRDIIDAVVDGTEIDPLITRCAIWANRWNEAYNNAVALIVKEMGGNLEWEYGDTEHCETCNSLNGIVARASEWEELGVKPQSPPNDALDCGGWHCGCGLSPTTKRRSPNAYQRIMNAVTKV